MNIKLHLLGGKMNRTRFVNQCESNSSIILHTLFKNVLVNALLICLMVSPVHGGVTGKISGYVIASENQNPIIGATIQLVGTNKGRISDGDGHFTILNIRPGVYNLRISYMGYKTVLMENIQVRADLSTKVNVALDFAVLEGEEVTVLAPASSIEKDLTATRGTVGRDQFESLPINSVRDALSLQTGVAGTGSNPNVRGGRSREVAYLIDGVYVQDPFLGSFAADIGSDAIEELSLLSGTFNAEYGNALSGVVNIVTREGGRKWSARVESRQGAFDYPDSLKPEGPKTNWFVSGPLLSQKLRIFVSGEHADRDSYLPSGFRNEDSYVTKLTYTGIPNVKINGMYRSSSRHYQYYNHKWSYVQDLWYQYKSSREHTTFNITHALTQNFFYDVRISKYVQNYRQGIWIDSTSTWKDSSEYEPYFDYTYNPNLGNGTEFVASGNPPSYDISRSATIDFRGDFVWQVNHWNEIKTGLQFKSHNLDLLDIYDPAREHPYLDDYNEKPYESAAYFQDKIEFPYIVVNIGLRYDHMNGNADFRANPLQDSTIVKATPQTQLSPRLGIAHPISDRTKIHFAYGHFFQNPMYAYLYTNTRYDITVKEPVFGQPDLDAERTIAYEVGLTHQFNNSFEGRFTAYYKDITGLIGTHYYPAYADDDPGRFVAYTLIVNEDYANSKGFEVNLKYDRGKYFSSGLAYTFSISKGSASSADEQYPGTLESTRLYYLKFDRPHGFNMYGKLSLGKKGGPKIFNIFPFSNTTIGWIARASSGYPYTPTGRDVGLADLNSFRKPSTHSIDIETSKSFTLTGKLYGRVFMEIQNVTDVRNVRLVFTSTGDPDYTVAGDHSEEYMNNPSHFGPPRTIRLGLSLGWK